MIKLVTLHTPFLFLQNYAFSRFLASDSVSSIQLGNQFLLWYLFTPGA